MRMGTDARITIWTTADESRAAEVADAAFERIAQVEEETSDWLTHGIIAQLRDATGGEPIRLRGDLLTAMETAWPIVELTHGAFDPACGRLTMLWREARAEGVPPSDAQLRAAAADSGWARLQFDPRRSTITPEQSVPWLDFGGLAKGLAADAALELLRDKGMPRSLVNVGGDIAAGDAPPDQAGWYIAGPIKADGSKGAAHVLTRAGIATSGSTYLHMDVEGRRLSHVINPKTGAAVESRAQFTVTAPTAAEADALASAACVVGVDALRKMLRDHGVRYIVDVSP
ncbi:MAG: FAD:protein FMN transferase [Phycisphaerales bacterium]|nr:FAD:protein FMN transferase [Phycisphaerales bacterium]